MSEREYLLLELIRGARGRGKVSRWVAWTVGRDESRGSVLSIRAETSHELTALVDRIIRRHALERQRSARARRHRKDMTSHEAIHELWAVREAKRIIEGIEGKSPYYDCQERRRK